MPDVQGPDDTILHQDAVEEIIEDKVGETLDGVATENEAIDDIDPITGGQSPTEAEHNAALTAINEILGALRSSGVIPFST